MVKYGFKGENENGIYRGVNHLVKINTWGALTSVTAYCIGARSTSVTFIITFTLINVSAHAWLIFDKA